MPSQGTRIWERAVRALLLLLLLLGTVAHAQQATIKRNQPPSMEVSLGDAQDKAGKLYCLVVGVCKYAHPGIPELRLAVKDAKDFAAFVKTQSKYLKEVHVKELLDKEATRVNILRYLSYDLRNVGTDDTVLLYFSGHGSIDTKFASDYFFMSYDADPEFPVITAVQLSREQLLSRIKAKRVMVVLDACHSGTPAMHRNVRTRSTGQSLKGFLEQFKESQGQVIITSSSPNEYAMEYPDLPNGVFTHFLLEGLNGKADRDGDKIVSAREAYEYAYEMTKRRTEGGQHPVWSGDMSGTFPLALLKAPGGTLELVTDPGQVNVSLVEGSRSKPLGKTDASGKMTITGLPVGKPLFLKYSKEGWDDAVPDPLLFAPDAQEIRNYLVRLNPVRAHLALRTQVPAVNVRFNNEDRGATDGDGFMIIEDVQVGVSHELVLAKEGFLEKKQTVLIPLDLKNRVFRWEAKLDRKAPEYVEVAVSTEPGEVEVYVGDADKAAGKTDGRGNLKLPLKGPGKTVLRFHKPGHAAETREFSIPPAGSFPLAKVKLSKIEPTLRLSVNQPGAEIFIKRAQARSAQPGGKEPGYEYEGETTANGSLTVKNLPLGVPVMVKIKKDGWQEQVLGPFVFTDDSALLSPPQVALVRVVTVRPVKPEPPAKLTATDLLVSTDPVQVSVSINGEYKGETDKKGELRIKGVPVDKPLNVEFKKYGFVSVKEAVTFPAVASFLMDKVVLNRLRTRVEVSASESFADILVRHAEDYVLAGRTDSLGKAVLEDLPVDKQLSIKIMKEGWREKSLGPLKLTDREPQVKLNDIKLEPAMAVVKIRTDPAGVKAKVNGVEKKATGGSFLTLADMQVQTDYEVELFKEGFLSKHVYLRVPAQYEGRTFSPDAIALERACAKLELRTEFPGVMVTVDGMGVDKTDREGKVVVERVPVGTNLTVMFEKEGFVKKPVKVTVPIDYAGVTYRRKEVVILEPEPKPVDRTARKETAKPPSAPSPQEQSYRAPSPEPAPAWPSESRGSRSDPLPTGSAGFPADFGH